MDVGYATDRWNGQYLGKRVTTLNLVEGGLSARHDLTRTFYVTLHAEASTLLPASLRRSVHAPTLANGGAALGVELK